MKSTCRPWRRTIKLPTSSLAPRPRWCWPGLRVAAGPTGRCREPTIISSRRESGSPTACRTTRRCCAPATEFFIPTSLPTVECNPWRSIRPIICASICPRIRTVPIAVSRAMGSRPTRSPPPMRRTCRWFPTTPSSVPPTAQEWNFNIQRRTAARHSRRSRLLREQIRSRLLAAGRKCAASGAGQRQYQPAAFRAHWCRAPGPSRWPTSCGSRRTLTATTTACRPRSKNATPKA